MHTEEKSMERQIFTVGTPISMIKREPSRIQDQGRAHQNFQGSNKLEPPFRTSKFMISD